MDQVTGLVLEGIPATGKSTLINRLSRHPAILEREFMSFFTYGEEITQRVLEKKHNQGRITKRDNLQLLEDIVGPLENYKQYYQQRWPKAADHKFAFLLERFHLTHVTYFDYLDWVDVAEFDQRLARLNAKLCLLTLSRDVMTERIIHNRGQQWRNYISRFGNTESEIVEYYVKVQKKKKELAAKSKLPELIVDTSQIDRDNLAETVIDFWRNQIIL